MNYDVDSFSEFVGQEQAKAILIPALKATKFGKNLDNICFYGPAGTGKTTISRIIAKSLNTECITVDARNLKKVEEFTNIVTSMKDNDVLFVDEIHGLNKNLEELFYEAITKHQMNIILKNGRTAVLPVNSFVFVGATTKLGELSSPLRSRFPMLIEMVPYTVDELTVIAINKARKNDIYITHAAAFEIAKRSRGTARIAENLLSLVQNYALTEGKPFIGPNFIENVMNRLNINVDGLTKKDKDFLRTLKETERPTSLASIAAMLNDSEDNLYETVEPYLLQKGYIYRTPRGRMLTDKGKMVA